MDLRSEIARPVKENVLFLTFPDFDRPFGSPIPVAVAVPLDEVSWLPAPWFLGGINLSVQSTMRAKRPE